MDGFGLLVGHMIGDFVVQNDFLAKWKAATPGAMDPATDAMKFGKWKRPWYRWRPFTACTVHCLLYTLAVWSCSFWWMPWWGLIACFLAHWPIDRFALAGRWMRNVSGQKFFASKEHPMWPNSVVLVDNTFHLLTLFVIGLICGRCS